MPRVVMLTAGEEFAERVVVKLGARGCPPDAVLVVPRSYSGRTPAPSRLGLLREPRRVAAALLGRAQRLLAPPRADGPARRFAGLTAHCQALPSLNGPATEAALRELSPDYVVIAGSGGVGILKENLLAIPKRGTINAHPALLPWVRGLHCIERSIERRVPIGVSIHYLDAGIDTGALIRRALVPAFPTDDCQSLRKKSRERVGELLVETVLAAQRGQHPDGFVQAARFPYPKRMSAAEIAASEALVGAGAAVELYARWRAYYGSDEIPPERADCPER